MTTMRDVAKKAGVGVGTVSRALSDTGYTAKATREKIFAAADEMGYAYDSASKSPVKTGIIGVMVPLLEHPFFAKMTDCLEAELYKHGYKCMIFNNCGNEADPTGVIYMLDTGILAGLISLADPPSDFLGRKCAGDPFRSCPGRPPGCGGLFRERLPQSHSVHGSQSGCRCKRQARRYGKGPAG